MVIQLGGNQDLESAIGTTITDSSKIKAYRIAVGKERNNLYKPIEYETNYGYYTYIDPTVNGNSITLSPATRAVSEIYKVDVVLSDTVNSTTDVYTDKMTISINGTTSTAVIPTTTSSTRTVEFEINPSGNSTGSITISFADSTTTVTIKEIKIYYK